MTRRIDRAVQALLTAWFVVTVLCQHPDRSYDRLRRYDRSGLLIPNWRFFAPEPAVEDQHFLYRLASADQQRHTPWRAVFEAAPRRAVHAVWFPGRRIEKGVFDAAAALTETTNTALPAHAAARRAAYEIVVDFVRARLQPAPDMPLVQVMLVRYSGYDHSEVPKYDMISDYEPVAP